MTRQISDPFIWKGRTFTFCGASDEYQLFDPKKYNLKPKSPHTACWKGFVLHFELKEKELYLEKLEVYCEDDYYPDINGVKAKETTEFLNFFHNYDNLSLKLSYTGSLAIGIEKEDFFTTSYIMEPERFEEIFELDFENGVLVAERKLVWEPNSGFKVVENK